jgi:CarD family transcriptional regulator
VTAVTFLITNKNIFYKLNLVFSGRRLYMFNIGDHIVYPMHGAGIIDAIEEKSILGEKQSYYILKMPGEVKVMVPTNKAEEIGVRNIIDKNSANKVFELLEEEKTEMSMNWNKRYRDNMDKMKSGDIYEIADVVRNLSFKQKEKGLSTGEKKMLSNAKQILVSELVLVENSSPDEIEGLIENKINASFKEFEIDNIEPVKNIVNKFIPFEETGTSEN